MPNNCIPYFELRWRIWAQKFQVPTHQFIQWGEYFHLKLFSSLSLPSGRGNHNKAYGYLLGYWKQTISGRLLHWWLISDQPTHYWSGQQHSTQSMHLVEILVNNTSCIEHDLRNKGPSLNGSPNKCEQFMMLLELIFMSPTSNYASTHRTMMASDLNSSYIYIFSIYSCLGNSYQSRIKRAWKH